MQGRVTQELVQDTMSVDTPHGRLSVVPGKPGGRAMTMLTRQPATIAWIDAFQPNSVFWDVGANIGVYTLYAALRRDIRVAGFQSWLRQLLPVICQLRGQQFDDCVQCPLVGLGRERLVARLEVSVCRWKSFSFLGKDQPHGPAGRIGGVDGSVD